MDVPEVNKRRAGNTMSCEGSPVLPIGNTSSLDWGDSVDVPGNSGERKILGEGHDNLPQGSGWVGPKVPVAISTSQDLPADRDYASLIFIILFLVIIAAYPFITFFMMKNYIDGKMAKPEPVIQESPAPPELWEEIWDRSRH